MKALTSLVLAGLMLVLSSATTSDSQSEGWVTLFDGKTLSGWKAAENPATFTVADGAIVVFGKRAHLFYDGPLKNHDFKNFEFKAQVMNEIQVNNTHTDWRKTGSVYAIQDVKEAPAKDNEWFTQHIIVNGKKITVKVNDKVINEYTEGENGRLSSGTIALQGHDPKSKVYYKDIMIKPLPD
jgi:hypothetical protein